MNHKEISISWDETACLIRSLGQKSFAEDCLRFICRHVVTDHFAVFVFDQSLKPNFVAGASPPDKKNLVIDTGKEYIRYFYMSDPNVGYISNHENQTGTPLMFRQKAKDISDDNYREHIYTRKGLLERVSWIGMAGSTWFSANLYRDKDSGYYSSDDLDNLQQIGNTVCAAIEQHIVKISLGILETESRPSLDYLQQLVTRLDAGLSQREIQVCARALMGMTRNGIALDLEIKPATVATLTQRAHSKLGISSLNELFAICLQALTKER